MRSLTKKLLLLVACGGLFLSPAALAAPPDDAGIHAERQPRMRAALAALHKALDNLEHASHDKGGHRVKAIAETKRAIAQVKKGIRHDNRSPRKDAGDGDLQLRRERQPRMKAALGFLLEARAKLDKASRDKGGHRVKAIAHIDKAIKHVKKGIRHDNRTKRR